MRVQWRRIYPRFLVSLKPTCLRVIIGWIQECGEAFVSVSGQTQAAYADFRPNAAKHHLKEELLKGSQEQVAELPSGALGEKPLAHDTWERLSQLPPLLIEDGPYCGLIKEARDVFVDGHFYACVAMCGISFERFQRDKAAPHGATQKDKMGRVRSILKKNKVLSQKLSPYARAWQSCGTNTHMDMG